MNDLIKQMDLLNTINGGVSMTYVDVKTLEDKMEIHVNAPSVKPEAYQIFLNVNELVIISTVQDESFTAPMVFNYPMFFKNIALPANIDESKIEAIEEDGHLKVVVPFKKDQSNQRRRIEIKHK